MDIFKFCYFEIIQFVCLDGKEERGQRADLCIDEAEGEGGLEGGEAGAGGGEGEAGECEAGEGEAGECEAGEDGRLCQDGLRKGGEATTKIWRSKWFVWSL